MTASLQPRRFLRLKQVKEIVGLGTTSIYELMGEGNFPQHYRIGKRAVAWKSDEIENWVQSRLPQS